jgi:exodeoxyribonuclease V alpha subunit
MNPEPEFSAIDRQFGDFLQRLTQDAGREVRLAAACASRARAEGHICARLSDIARIEGTVNAATLREKLRASKVVGAPGAFTPLVLDAQDRLYLRRYWEYEQQLARAILNRAGIGEGAATIQEEDPQDMAAAKAVTNRFTVITGGPGTGKTRTVQKILARLLGQPGGSDLRISLAAPTGKAAARLTDAVREIDEKFAATTIHRLLGYLPGSPYFRHSSEHPLTCDILIVDEASMVDLALMAKLVTAVPDHARLVLLGDRDQLASVEAGNVLADICAAAQAGEAMITGGPRAGRLQGASAGKRDGGFASQSETPLDGELKLEPARHRAAPLRDVVVALQKNYRFAESGGIYTVSTAINGGDSETALATLRQDLNGEVRWQKLPASAKLVSVLRDRIIAGYESALKTSDPGDALARLQEFRILCAVRHGPFGVENLNAIAEEIFADAGLLAPRRGCYRGQPLMITQNDYHLALFNGDSGIILPDPEAEGELRAFFLSAEGKLRRFLPARLPLHETAFAMTVHKSQGSEFERLLLILPEKDGPLLTRELLYTAITRARAAVELWANEDILRAAISRRTVRQSGLRDALLAG